MNDKKSLTFGMAILFIVVIASFSYIIINDKASPFMLNIAKKKLTNYVKKTYKSEENNFKYSKVTYNKKKKLYKIKVTNKNDKNKYFIISLKRGKYEDTYKKTYKKEGVIYE